MCVGWFVLTVVVLLKGICGSGRFGRGRAQLQSHPHDFTLLSDRLPEFLADSNDATTHASWLGVLFCFLIPDVIWFIETFTTTTVRAI